MNQTAQRSLNNMSSISGQAALITLLLLSVVLVIVLSVVSRSIEDVSFSSREDRSARALTAAEAGIEQYLATGDPDGSFPGSNSSFNSSVSGHAAGSGFYSYPSSLRSGDTANFWFVSHNETDDLVCNSAGGLPCTTASGIDVCWGDTTSTGDTDSAVEVSIFYDTNLNAAVNNNNFSGVTIHTSAFDPNSARPNNFSDPSAGTCVIDGTTYPYHAIVNLNSVLPASCASTPGCVLAVTTRLFYNENQDHQVGMRLLPSTASFPAQARLIESTGISGDATRKIEVIQPFSELPSIFMAAMYSQGGISK